MCARHDHAHGASTELREAEGRELGVTDWHEITQAEVDAFADVTGDHQWIHVDPERAAQSPLGGTIAHGLLTLVARAGDDLVAARRSRASRSP